MLILLLFWIERCIARVTFEAMRQEHGSSVLLLAIAFEGTVVLVPMFALAMHASRSKALVCWGCCCGFICFVYGLGGFEWLVIRVIWLAVLMVFIEWGLEEGGHERRDVVVVDK